MTSKHDYETDDYFVDVREGLYEGACTGHPVYVLINKLTHVREGESISLPDAIGTMLQRQVYLDEAREYYQNGYIPPSTPPTEPPEVH